jgi:hypothetical protein
MLFAPSQAKEIKPVKINPCEACILEGIFSGIATDSKGHSSPLAYEFRENNLTVGYVTTDEPAVTFGGYKFSCDSLTISSFYNGNESYYLLKASVDEEKAQIIGTFQNLTDKSDFGTFKLSRNCNTSSTQDY